MQNLPPPRTFSNDEIPRPQTPSSTIDEFSFNFKNLEEDDYDEHSPTYIRCGNMMSLALHPRLQLDVHFEEIFNYYATIWRRISQTDVNFDETMMEL